MTDAEGDPHAVETSFDATDAYQAPPRESERNELEGNPARRPGDERPVDVNLLESQRRGSAAPPSESLVTDLSEKTYTISGPDEAAEPAQPDAVPPGESM